MFFKEETMKAKFIKKPTSDELLPTDEFVIEKEIVIDNSLFQKMTMNPLHDYDFIESNKELIYLDDDDDVRHCIFVTSKEVDYGILIDSQGSNYIRYGAYFPKALLKTK